MAWWKFFSRANSGPTLPASGSSTPPDMSEFMRASFDLSALGSSHILGLAAFGAGLRPETPPRLVPFEVLEAITYHPVFYTGARLVTAPACDPELYYVRCDDSNIAAETWAWLQILLTGQRAPVLGAVVRGFTYGSIPIVLDWETSTLKFKVEGKSKSGLRNKTIENHVHYSSSHEIYPADVRLKTRNDLLLGVEHAGKEYGAEDLADPARIRAYLSVWDSQFGRFDGHAAARRAFRSWLEGQSAELWRIRYLERSVDLPRVGFAPQGDLTIDGEKIPAVKLLRAQIMALRNGSTIVLPTKRDEQGNDEWRIEVLDSPDRAETFEKTVDSYDRRLLWAVLSGTDDGKASEDQFMDSVQSVADFTAGFLTRIARNVVRMNHGDEVCMPTVIANDVPKRKQRLLKEIFAASANAVQHTQDGKIYTLAELVDPEILDQLGVERRSVNEAAHGGPSVKPEGKPGRPLDLTSDREERRDDSETIDNEEDTGGDDMDQDENAP